MSWDNSDFKNCPTHGLYNAVHDYCPLCTAQSVTKIKKPAKPTKKQITETTEKLPIPIAVMYAHIYYVRVNKAGKIFAYFYDEHWFSRLELVFWLSWKEISPKMPIPEYRFSKQGKWAFDFAWPLCKVAVELEGGLYGHGRHNRAKGYINDLVKYNHAIELGWRVLRYESTKQDYIKQIQRVIGDCNG